jgi:hypothetical protein
MYFISIRLLYLKIILAFNILTVSICVNTFAQVLQPQRFEVPLGSTEPKFEVIPASANGLFLYREFTGPAEDAVQLVKLDTAFNQQWGGYVPVERDYLIMGKKAFHNKLYLLLRYRNYSKNDFHLLIIDADGNYLKQIIKGYIPIAPTEFQVTDKAVIIGGYYNHVPLVLYYSTQTFHSRIVPAIFNETGELTQVKTYEDGSFDVLISALNFLKQRTIWIKNYDSDGNLNVNYALRTDSRRNLIFGRSVTTENNTKLIAGVYGSRYGEFSHGVFIASIDAAGVEQIRYYHFGDLENFFKYMKAKREMRVKSRIERRKIKGKKVRLNYRFLVHEIIPYKDQYILLGEAFYPRYTSTNSSYGGFFNPVQAYGGGLMQNGRVFDGYYYTHAVVMGFDKLGKLLWDNSFEINDVRTMTLEQFVRVEIQDDKIALLYLFDNKIRTKIIQDNQVLEGKSEDAIKPSSPNDIVRNNKTETSKLNYWYNDYLFAYGVQEIEKTPTHDRHRVFYINKLRHGP